MTLHPVRPGDHVPLSDADAAPPGDLPRGDELEREIDGLREKTEDLATALHAEGKQALLVVLQARDAGGKDGTVKRVFGAVPPQWLRVVPFGPPTADELAHDFLWRAHAAVPEKGRVGVFSRSHYEDVLVARVRKLVPKEVWQKRYDHINDFERLLHESGTTVLKLFLHISRDEQARRFRERLGKRHKRWKFDPGDLGDRERWGEYTDAYRDVFARCSTPHAPWYVVPADDKPARNLLVARLLVRTLEKMAPEFPAPDFDVDEMRKRID
jgi:PPK2 family polyphosphate:nucleotide phosphotransferase